MIHPTRMLLLLLTLLLALAPQAMAQRNTTPQNKPKTQAQKNANEEASLLKRVEALESQVALLKEQLEIFLGTDEAYTIKRIPIEDSPFQGPDTARITLVMFGDYQSDYTVRAHHVVTRLLKTYPNDLRFVFKHYPLSQLHPLANKAALAAIAAGKQGRFWEMHELLLKNSRSLSQALFISLAEQLGLEVSRFNTDMQSLATLELLDKDEKSGAQIGVAGVPTLYLNGRILPTWRHDYVNDQIKKSME